MDAEEVIKLFELNWFGGEESITKSSPSLSLQNPDLVIVEDLEKSELLRVSSRHVRSFSDQFSSQTSLDSDTLSPKSVLTTQYKLQTIVSGKEGYVAELEIPKIEDIVIIEKPKQQQRKKQRRNRGSSSKSLSDLEFEELKGFMDLGFVFSEEDKNSSLVSIIPGLQRLGQEEHKQAKHEEEEDEDEEYEEEDKFFEERQMVPRPYLSEAWEVMNQRRETNQLMNWRFPALTNEIDMKHHLRSWAHSVASTVR